QLPAVGARLQRAGLHRRALARLPPRAALRRGARVPAPRPPVRRRPDPRDGLRSAVALYRDRGVVLRTYKLGEADRIVVMLTRGHGKIRAVAKGIRKTKSRFGGRLEPASHVDLLVYEGRGDLDIVSQAETVDHFAHVRDDLERLGRAVAILEAADQ